MTAQYSTCTTINGTADSLVFQSVTRLLLLPFVLPSPMVVLWSQRWWLLGLQRQGFLAKSSLLGRVLVLFYGRKRRVLGFMSWRDLNSLFFGGDQHHWWQLRVSFCLVLKVVDTVGYCYVFIAFGKYIWLVGFGFCCILWRVLGGKGHGQI